MSLVIRLLARASRRAFPCAIHLIATAACGGKVAPGDPSPAPAEPVATATASTPAGPSDASVPSLPVPPNPLTLDAVCQAAAERNTRCGHPWSGWKGTCLGDVSKGTCGNKALAWYSCIVRAGGCGAPPECNSSYCAYVTCNGPPPTATLCSQDGG